MYVMPTSTASSVTLECTWSDFSHSLLSLIAVAFRLNGRSFSVPKPQPVRGNGRCGASVRIPNTGKPRLNCAHSGPFAGPRWNRRVRSLNRFLAHAHERSGRPRSGIGARFRHTPVVGSRQFAEQRLRLFEVRGVEP